MLRIFALVALVAFTSAAKLVNFDGREANTGAVDERAAQNDEQRAIPDFKALNNMLYDLSRRTDDSECDDACVERRALRMLPIARRFATRIGGHVAKRFEDEGRLKSYAKRLAQDLADARNRRMYENDVFGRGVNYVAGVHPVHQRGVNVEGRYPSKEFHARELAEQLRAARRRALEQSFFDKREEEEKEEEEVRGLEAAENAGAAAKRAIDLFLGRRDADEDVEGMEVAEGVRSLGRRAVQILEDAFRKRSEEDSEEDEGGEESKEKEEEGGMENAEKAEEAAEDDGMQAVGGVEAVARRASEFRDAFLGKREDDEEEDLEGMRSAEGLQGMVRRALEGIHELRREAEYKRSEGVRAARHIGEEVEKADLARALRNLLRREEDEE